MSSKSNSTRFLSHLQDRRRLCAAHYSRVVKYSQAARRADFEVRIRGGSRDFARPCANCAPFSTRATKKFELTLEFN